MKTYLRKPFIILYCIMFILLCYPLQGKSEALVPLKDKTRSAVQKSSLIVGSEYEEKYYSDVEQLYIENGYKPAENVEITVKPGSIKSTDNEAVPLQTGTGGRAEPSLVWEDSSGSYEWEADIPSDGLYEIAVEYYALPGSGLTPQRELMINGEVPFTEAHNISFQRMWKDKSKPRINNIGDEVTPSQVEVRKWQSAALTDNLGMYPGPLLFYLKEGKNVLRMNYVDQPLSIGDIIIRSPGKIPAYKELAEQYKTKGYADAKQEVKFQAETNISYKSDPPIGMQTNGDPMTEPVSKGYRKLNVVGDWQWRSGNQSITWDFTVPEDGLYKIGMRLGQWWGDGMPSYRQISIDGKVPFEEMKEYQFVYKNDFRTEILKDTSGEPYRFYLQKGEHQLTMKVVAGPVTDVVHDIIKDSKVLSALVRQIIMITGNIPDPNYDYELDKTIPGIMDDLKGLSESMQKQADRLTAVSTKRPSAANNFLTIKSQLDAMLRNPDLIAKQLTDMNNALESLGAYVTDLQQFPLVVDYFRVVPPESRLSDVKSNIFQKLSVTWSNFIASFYKDYTNTAGYLEDENYTTTVKIWVSYGKEWAEIIKRWADEEFTPKTGIAVNINVTPAHQISAVGGLSNPIMLAIISGNAPDVLLGTSIESPVEFAIRGAAVDLKQFSDYEDIEKRFLPALMTPFQYRGGIYGFPDLMGFKATFYRKDIIEGLGISLPETWDDLYQKVLPVLYQNNLQFGFDYFDLPLFVFQNGADYYTEDGMRSALDTPEGYRGFKEYTDLYTSYGLPEVANIYNRFRIGEMPLAIGNISLYMYLTVAAPELFGRWGIAPIPGHLKQDGTIDRTVTNGSAGAENPASMILSGTRKKDASWEFLKWWSSAEMQIHMDMELEAAIGVASRWHSANIEAFKAIPWKMEDEEVMISTWDDYKEMPVVLGGYFTKRHAVNAWNRVVLGGMNARDSLEQAVEDINKELAAKQEEYGVHSGNEKR